MVERAKPSFVIDNQRVRVGDWQMGPDTHIGPHVHNNDYLIVALSEGELTITTDDEDLAFPMELGATVFGNKDDAHDVLNSGGWGVRFLEIELKK